MKRIVISVLAGSLLVGSQAFALGIGGVSVGGVGVGVAGIGAGFGGGVGSGSIPGAAGGLISFRGISVTPDGQIMVPAVMPRAAGDPSGNGFSATSGRIQSDDSWNVCSVPEHCR